MWPSLSVFEVRFRGFDGCLFYTIIRASCYSSCQPSPLPKISHHWNIRQVVVLFLFQAEWWLMSCLFSSHVQTSVWRWTLWAFSSPLQRPDVCTVTSTAAFSYKIVFCKNIDVIQKGSPHFCPCFLCCLGLWGLSSRPGWVKSEKRKVMTWVKSEWSYQLQILQKFPLCQRVKGTIATRGCSSDANPAATKAWCKKNVDRPSFLLGNGPQLVVSHIQLSRSGEYYCTAEKGSGRRTSNLRVWNVSETIQTENITFLQDIITASTSAMVWVFFF